MDDKTKRISIVVCKNADGSKKRLIRYVNDGVRVMPWSKNELFEGESSPWVVHVLAKHNGTVYGLNLQLETWYRLYEHWFHGEKLELVEFPEYSRSPSDEIVCNFMMYPKDDSHSIRLVLCNRSRELTLSSAQYSFKQFDTMLRVIKQMPETREDWKNFQSAYAKGKK